MQNDERYEVLWVDNETTAVVILKEALEREFEGRTLKLDFDAWPTVNLRYEGDKFHGTIRCFADPDTVGLDVSPRAVFS